MVFKRNKVINKLSLSVKIRLLKSNLKNNRSDIIKPRVKLVKNIVNNLNIPIIYNGNIFKYDDIDKYKKLTNCIGVMISRGAIYNPSIFNKSRYLNNINNVIDEYIELSKKYKYKLHPTKFVMEKIILSQSYFKKSSKIFKEFHKSSTYEQCKLINQKLKLISTKKIDDNINSMFDDEKIENK